VVLLGLMLKLLVLRMLLLVVLLLLMLLILLLLLLLVLLRVLAVWMHVGTRVLAVRGKVRFLLVRLAKTVGISRDRSRLRLRVGVV
jgi:hypothetical protein